MVRDDIEPLLPEGLKLAWGYQYGFYCAHAVNGAVSIVVKRITVESHYGQWEIIIGTWYFSRDREKYFTHPSLALLQAEKVMLAIAKKLVEIL